MMVDAYSPNYLDQILVTPLVERKELNILLLLFKYTNFRILTRLDF